MIFIRVSEINIMYIQYEYRGLLSTGLRFRAGASSGYDASSVPLTCSCTRRAGAVYNF